ncbi:hypothetical protein AVEN_270361-1 [Araneus ventricosus]|uniref:Uncharacterized protein n=1 Tax=Araneus ventricosus TaxID=182803 RepID=A0A4Y2MGJ9_ARAVE|nr:hypothetical protein AVEN_270361-1 [Araneus ventricosus]
MNFMLGDEVIGDSFQPFLFEVWHWLPHTQRRCEDTLRGIMKCRASSTTAALIAVREVTPFEVLTEDESDGGRSRPAEGLEESQDQEHGEGVGQQGEKHAADGDDVAHDDGGIPTYAGGKEEENEFW